MIVTHTLGLLVGLTCISCVSSSVDIDLISECSEYAGLKVPLPGSCNQYIQCEDDTNIHFGLRSFRSRNFRSRGYPNHVVETCPKDTVFYLPAKGCVESHEAPCYIDNCKSAISEYDYKYKLPLPGSCDKYIECDPYNIEFRPEVKTCPKGQVFNDKNCVDSQVAPCYIDVCKTSATSDYDFKLALPGSCDEYIECDPQKIVDRPYVKKCPNGQVFYHKTCVDSHVAPCYIDDCNQRAKEEYKWKISVPGFCDKFIQCDPHETLLRPLVEKCPLGEFFYRKACVKSHLAECAYDPCYGKTHVKPYWGGETCHGVFECRKGRSYYENCYSGPKPSSIPLDCKPDPFCRVVSSPPVFPQVTQPNKVHPKDISLPYVNTQPPPHIPVRSKDISLPYDFTQPPPHIPVHPTVESSPPVFPHVTQSNKVHPKDVNGPSHIVDNIPIQLKFGDKVKPAVTAGWPRCFENGNEYVVHGSPPKSNHFLQRRADIYGPFTVLICPAYLVFDIKECVCGGYKPHY